MKYHYMYILLLLLLLALVSGVTGFETKQLHIQNETLNITPVFNAELCGEEQTSIFKIQRTNYHVGIQPLEFSYLFATNNYSEHISKSINKYSSSNTGRLYFSQTTTATVSMVFQDHILEWNASIVCNNTTISNNQTINNVSSNSSAPYVTNETTVNETSTPPNTQTNQSNEGTQNETTGEQNTQNNLNTTTINSTDQTNCSQISCSEITTNTTQTNNNNTANASSTTYEEESNNSNETLCINTTKIYTNKDIFEVGEKLEMNFYMHPRPDAFTIEYWIEDIFSTIVKRKYNTTNTNTKSYTFSSIDEAEKSYLIKTKITGPCKTVYQEKIVIVKNNDQTTLSDEQEESDSNTDDPNTNEEEKQSSIGLEILTNSSPIEVQTNIYKGDTRKSVVYFYAQDENETKLSKKYKLKLLDSNSHIEQTLFITLEKTGVSYVEIVAEGLGIRTTKTIQKNTLPTTQNQNNEEKVDEKTEEANEQKNIPVSLSNRASQNESQLKPIISQQKEKENQFIQTILVVVLFLSALLATRQMLKNKTLVLHLKKIISTKINNYFRNTR